MSNTKTNRKKFFDFDEYERPPLWRHIYLKWEFEWKYIPTNIKYGIENIISWFKIIWNDRDWDHRYLYNILQFKLERMKTYNDEHQYVEDSPNKVKYLSLVTSLMEKVSDEFYYYEWHSYRKVEHYSVPYEAPEDSDEEYKEFISDKEGLVQIETELLEDNLDDYFNKYPRELSQLLEEKPEYDITDSEQRGTIALYLSIRIHNKAKRIMFKIMEEKIERWWV